MIVERCERTIGDTTLFSPGKNTKKCYLCTYPIHALDKLFFSGITTSERGCTEHITIDNQGADNGKFKINNY